MPTNNTPQSEHAIEYRNGSLHVIHNVTGLPRSYVAQNGLSIECRFARTRVDFLRLNRERPALLVVNCDPGLAMTLALGRLLSGRKQPRLIVIDVILRKPKGLRRKLATPVKRALFAQVDYFIHHFAELATLDELYGIGADRSGYVPFKANLWELRAQSAQPDGDYVLCFGRSSRDYDTFLEAMEQLPYPGAIVDPRVAKVLEHGSRFTRPLRDLPQNVTILDHDCSNASESQILSRAKLVVLPILKEKLSSPCSAMFDAMAMGKCVIASDGVGIKETMRDQVLHVEPENATSLAHQIRNAWENDSLRLRTAELGHAYAVEHGGGEKELCSRLLDHIASWAAEHLIHSS